MLWASLQRYPGVEGADQSRPPKRKATNADFQVPDLPKPDSPKLGFRVRVRVSVSANRDWTDFQQNWIQSRLSPSFKERKTTQLVWYWQQSVTLDSGAKSLLRQLHWLPVRQRIQYKVAVLTRTIRTTGAPSYLRQHLVQHVATHQTRSMALPLLTIPRTNTEFARRSYSYSAPFLWNSLPGPATS